MLAARRFRGAEVILKRTFWKSIHYGATWEENAFVLFTHMPYNITKAFVYFANIVFHSYFIQRYCLSIPNGASYLFHEWECNTRKRMNNIRRNEPAVSIRLEFCCSDPDCDPVRKYSAFPAAVWRDGARCATGGPPRTAGFLCINKRHINILGALHMMIMMDTNWQEECVVSFVIGRRVEMFSRVAFAPTGLLIRYRPAVIIRRTFSAEDEWTSNALISVFSVHVTPHLKH